MRYVPHFRTNWIAQVSFLGDLKGGTCLIAAAANLKDELLTFRTTPSDQYRPDDLKVSLVNHHTLTLYFVGRSTIHDCTSCVRVDFRRYEFIDLEDTELVKSMIVMPKRRRIRNTATKTIVTSLQLGTPCRGIFGLSSFAELRSTVHTQEIDLFRLEQKFQSTTRVIGTRD